LKKHSENDIQSSFYKPISYTDSQQRQCFTKLHLIVGNVVVTDMSRIIKKGKLNVAVCDTCQSLLIVNSKLLNASIVDERQQ